MRFITTLLALSGCLVMGSVQAADPAPKDKPTQQTRMKTCNADAKAKSLKGADRKAFMSDCLKAK